MGGIVARDLSEDYDVTVLDLSTGTDVTDPEQLRAGTVGTDVVVGCLPSHLGAAALQTCVNEGHNYVDLSFTDQDLNKVIQCPDDVIAVHDCGLCPGISNMVVGRALAASGATRIKDVDIYVGGISEDPRFPFGYVVTWCVDDLLEEYKRPARYRERGVIRQVDPLSAEAEKPWQFRNRPYEVFVSDGLRSLLELPLVNAREWTVRWPGHLHAMRDMLAHGGPERVKAALRNDARDKVILAVDIDGKRHAELEVTARDGKSAMALTTAHTCAAIARAVLEGAYTKGGIHASEQVGAELDAYNFVCDHMAVLGMDWRK